MNKSSSTHDEYSDSLGTYLYDYGHCTNYKKCVIFKKTFASILNIFLLSVLLLVIHNIITYGFRFWDLFFIFGSLSGFDWRNFLQAEARCKQLCENDKKGQFDENNNN